MAEVLRICLIVCSIPLLAVLIVYTVRHVRELDRRIEEYREEQQAAKSQPGQINPYQQIAELYELDGNGSRKKHHSNRRSSANRHDG
ncbi:MAG: hypothetical protein QHI38_04075 [Armatimonadota bacterium]|nr:hypothetical protein [Armatimonadota bacterium]